MNQQDLLELQPTVSSHIPQPSSSYLHYFWYLFVWPGQYITDLKETLKNIYDTQYEYKLCYLYSPTQTVHKKK